MMRFVLSSRYLAGLSLGATLLVPTSRGVAQSPGQVKAAQQLLGVMQMEQVTRQLTSSMVDVQLRQNPLLVPYADILRAWAQKYFTWDSMRPELEKAYASAFTEAELHELAAFYGGPTGQKLLQKQPELSARTAEAGRAIGAAHSQELQQMIAQRAAQLGKQLPAPERH